MAEEYIPCLPIAASWVICRYKAFIAPEYMGFVPVYLIAVFFCQVLEENDRRTASIERNEKTTMFVNGACRFLNKELGGMAAEFLQIGENVDLCVHPQISRGV